MDTKWLLTLVATNRSITFDRSGGVGFHDAHANKTFLTFASGVTMDPIVLEYDFSFSEFAKESRVATGTSHPNDYPKLIQSREGSLLLVWTDSVQNGIRIAKSKHPRSISGGWSVSMVASDENPAHPCVFKASNQDIYIFFRTKVTSDYRPIKFIKSTDDGESWTRTQMAIDSGGLSLNADPSNVNEVYYDCPQHFEADDQQPERFAFSWTNAGGGPNSTVHNNVKKDVFLAFFHPTTLTFSNVQSDKLGRVVDHTEMPTCLVFDTGSPKKKIVDYYFGVSFGKTQEEPIVVFNHNRTLTSATWVGDHWVYAQIEQGAPNNQFAVERVRKGDTRVLQARGGVRIYESRDQGTTWDRVFTVTKPTNENIKKVIKLGGVDGTSSIRLLALGNSVWTLGREPLPLTFSLGFSEIASNRALAAERSSAGGVFDPRSGKTFSAYPGPSMKPIITQYDHTTSQFSSHTIMGSTIGLDFHNYPTLTITSTGHLLVVWTDQSVGIFIARSLKPRSIKAGWETTHISESPRYPCPIKSDNGDIFVFYRTRITSDYRPLRYIKSADSGLTWTKPIVAIDSGGFPSNGDYRNVNEVYNDCPRHQARTVSNPERFLFGWTNAGGGPNSTKHNLYHKDAHFAYFYPATLSFENVRGDDLGDFVGYDELRRCVVLDSGEHQPLDKFAVDYYFALSYFDDSGYPLVVYNYRSNLIASFWTGAAWNHTIVTYFAPKTMVDIVKTIDGRFRLFQAKDGITVYESSFGEPVFTSSQLWRPTGGGKVGKIIVINGGHEDFQILAMENNWTERSLEGKYRVWAVGLDELKLPKQQTEQETRLTLLLILGITIGTIIALVRVLGCYSFVSFRRVNLRSNMEVKSRTKTKRDEPLETNNEQHSIVSEQEQWSMMTESRSRSMSESELPISSLNMISIRQRGLTT